MLEKAPLTLQASLRPVILCGGSGTRLWPLSRVLYPKHVISLFSGESLFEGTMRRVLQLGLSAEPLIVSNANQRFIVSEQAARITNNFHLIVEPVSRNTAPAVTVAALAVVEEDADALLLVMPSDHVIRNESNFKKALHTATSAAVAGKLVTFGIPPTGPKTGYGYIVHGVEHSELEGCFDVEAFTEKPSAARAQALLEKGKAYWNSGIFVFSAKAFLNEVASHKPELLEACTAAWRQRQRDTRFTWLDEKAFAAAPKEPVDVAVMEKTKRAAVVMENLDWDDVGAWSSLWNIGPQDEWGNVLVGDAVTHDVRNCYINAQDTLVGAVGVEGLVVVATEDSVLITRMDHSENVRLLVAKMQEAGRSETERHNRVFRPWGNYKTINKGDRYLSKIITVEPGERLSRQMHYHRAEHWIVVRGVALVERGDEKILLHENESIYLPTGCYHRLENPGKIPLVLIEVQTGSYLAEDDIVRFEDDYGRKPAD